MDEQELAIVRRAYAKQILAQFGVEDAPRLEAAFAGVPREAFLGPGPWPILRGERYVPSPSADPVYLYTDKLVGIIPERRLNNGRPAFHAFLMSRLDPAPGAHVVHVGAGTGYYTAILAELVGAGGRVTAFEHDPELAHRAAANLAAYPQVAVVAGDGAAGAITPVDGIYVSAGAVRPAPAWLDGLAEGGRLLVPLSPPNRRRRGPDRDSSPRGTAFLIERRGDTFPARFVSPAWFIACEGAAAKDAVAGDRLAAAVAQGGADRVRSLRRGDDLPPPERCWLRGDGWCLSFDEPEG